MTRNAQCLLTLLFIPLLCTCDLAEKNERREKQRNYNWSHYGGAPWLTHYCAATEIDTLSVQNLEVAWTYRTGDHDIENHSQIQCNPIVVDGNTSSLPVAEVSRVRKRATLT